MNLTTQQMEELEMLAGAFRDGEATDAQVERLDALMASNPEVVEYFASYMELCGELRRRHAVEHLRDLTSLEPEVPARRWRISPDWFSDTRMAVAAAILLMATLTVAMLIDAQRRSAAHGVAVLMSAINAQWEDPRMNEDLVGRNMPAGHYHLQTLRRAPRRADQVVLPRQDTRAAGVRAATGRGGAGLLRQAEEHHERLRHHGLRASPLRPPGQPGEDGHPRQRRCRRCPQHHRAPRQLRAPRPAPRREAQGPHPPPDDEFDPHAGRYRLQDHRPRHPEGLPKERHRQVLRRRHLPEAQAARTAEGRQEADEVRGLRRDPPGSVHGHPRVD